MVEISVCARAKRVLSTAALLPFRPDQMLLLAGAMDGSVTVLAAASGTVLARHKSHAKYCVRVRWASDGQHFVSCSWDHTVAMHKYDAHTDNPSIQLLRTETYLSQVQDIEFVPAEGQPQSSLLVIALKNTNYLRLYDIEKLKVRHKLSCSLYNIAHSLVSLGLNSILLEHCQQ